MQAPSSRGAAALTFVSTHQTCPLNSRVEWTRLCGASEPRTVNSTRSPTRYTLRRVRAAAPG